MFTIRPANQLTNSYGSLDCHELENVIQQIVQSMVKLGAFQQIRGLRTWMVAPKQADFFESINVDFLEGAALQAKSK